LGGYDVYLNVAGGLKIGEPAADLAVAAALVSSLTGAPLPADAVHFGEASLTGAVRPVSQAQARLKEAAKLGFASAVIPSGGLDGLDPPVSVRPVSSLAELVAGIAASAPRRAPRETRDTAMRETRGSNDRNPPQRAVQHADWGDDEER
ncbi:MAG: DNA repair protein RadA, partial [Rhizobiales bacterium]|nr:DNA repair protein RadA [Hyphomicrobiales bacterium]